MNEMSSSPDPAAGIDAREASEAPGRSPVTRLPGWIALVGGLAALNYAGNLAVDAEPDREILYRWGTAFAGVVQYTIILVVLLVIARGLSRDVLGLTRPESWRRAAGLVVACLAAIWVIALVLGRFLDAGDEQGLVPDRWDGARWAPFLANALVVVVAAPVVEELTYRAVGIAVVRPLRGDVLAIAVTALAFGLGHGLIVALPVLTAFGAILGWLRVRTASVYPCMALHGIFNGAALLAAVTVGGGG
jgi:membrane protease YdiL (CAAX protease family)